MKHELSFKTKLLLLFFFLFAPYLVNAQTNLQLNKDKITLNPIGETEIRATGSTNLDVNKFTWAYNSDYLEITVSESGGAIVSKIKAKDKAITSLFIYATYDAKEIKQVEVTILPSIKGNELSFSPALGDSLEIIQNQTKEFNISGNAVLLNPSYTKVDVKPTDIANAYLEQNKLVITGKKSGGAEISILSNGQAVRTLKVKVLEAISRIEVIRVVPLKLKINEEKSLTDLVSLVNDKNVADFRSRLSLVSKDTNIVAVQGDKIIPKKTGITDVIVVPDGDVGKSRSILIEVSPTPDEIIPSLSSIQLRKDLATSLTWNIFGNGERVVDNSVDIVFDETQSSTNFSEYISLEKTGNQFRLKGLKRTASPLELAFRLAGSTKIKKISVQVDEFNVTDFRPLGIRIDLLDGRTATDLFGKKAKDEFHIAKIRLFNSIKKDDGTYYGKPILVYSESLEVKVALEIKSEHSGKWEELQENSPIFQTYFPNGITNYGQSTKNCAVIKAPRFFVPYRPMTFEMILNTYERRDDRNLRNRILLVANGVSSLTSFITAIAVPSPSSDLPLGLDKFQNLLIPSFEKLFPSTREVQRQNIVSMVMRPLEEIPFGSDVTRIIYIPKRPIKGLIPGHLIRISGVSITDSCAEVAVIDKNPTLIP